MSKPVTIQPWQKYLVVGITCFFIANAIWLNIVYREQFFQQGLNFIHDYQTDQNSSFVRVVYNLISILGNTIFLGILLICMFIFPFRRANALVYMSYMIFNLYLISVLKSAYAQVRPFWASSLINQWQWTCETAYGFPSGHSWISVLIYQPIISDFIGHGNYKIGLIFIIFTGGLVPVSRMYLGAHSSDQIVAGLMFSIAFTVLYRYLIQIHLFKFLKGCITEKRRKSNAILLLVFQCILFIPPILNYHFNTTTRIIPSQYLQRLNTVCQKSYSVQDFESKQASQSSIISVAFGFYYGMILLDTKWFNSPHTELDEDMSLRHFLAGRWQFAQNKYKNFFILIIYYIITALLTAGIFAGLIPAFVYNFYGDYILMTFGLTLVGIAWTLVVPILAFRYKIILPVKKLDQQLQGKQIQMGMQDNLGKKLVTGPGTAELFSPHLKANQMK